MTDSIENAMKSISRLELLDAICDAQSLGLFRSVATEGQNSCTLVDRLNISRKQYYTRISKLVKIGLIRRKCGKYTLTLFGEVVYEAHLLLWRAVEARWKLKAVESMNSVGEKSITQLTGVMDRVNDETAMKQMICAHS